MKIPTTKIPMPTIPDHLDDRAAAKLLRDGLLVTDAPFHPPQVVPGGYPRSLFEPVEQLEAVANTLRAEWEDELRRTHTVLIGAYLFGTRDPFTHAAGDVLVRLKWRSDPWAGELLNYSKVWKNNFANTVRGFSYFSQARCVITVSDAWRAEGPEAEAYRLTDEYKKHGLHRCPNREEIIMLQIESRQLRASIAIPYKRAGRTIVISPPEYKPDAEMSGRLTGLLHPLRDPITGKAAQS